jgi:hypothetical protein
MMFTFQRSGAHRVAAVALMFSLAATVVVSMAGCSALPRGGQSSQEAQAQLRAVPGISEVSVENNQSSDGFQQAVFVAVNVTIRPGYRIRDADQFVNLLLKVAWSSNEHKPNVSVALNITATPAISVAPLMEDAGWTTAQSLKQEPQAAVVDPTELSKKLGTWPGTTPKLPKDMLVPPSG